MKNRRLRKCYRRKVRQVLPPRQKWGDGMGWWEPCRAHVPTHIAHLPPPTPAFSSPWQIRLWGECLEAEKSLPPQCLQNFSCLLYVLPPRGMGRHEPPLDRVCAQEKDQKCWVFPVSEGERKGVPGRQLACWFLAQALTAKMCKGRDFSLPSPTYSPHSWLHFSLRNPVFI